LLVLSGEEYARIPFEELLNRIHQAIGWDDDVYGLFLRPDGSKQILRRRSAHADADQEIETQGD
jgi:hypothetical protein